MKDFGSCQIEKTVKALQEAIDNKKMQRERVQAQANSSSGLSHALTGILNRAGGSYLQLGEVWEHGGQYAQEFLKKIQENIKEKPWEVLRQLAVSSFAIGLFLGLRHRKSSRGIKE